MANNTFGRGNRIVSNAAANQPRNCIDVCANPICGDPSVLSLMAPLIYDEIGINLCTTFDLGTDISTTWPTAAKANIQVIDVAYEYGEGGVEIDNIVGRPNCYQITLSNLTATFAMNIFDNDCRLLGTLYPTAVYLPPLVTAPTFNEDTNPTSVTLEVFAPYGLSFNVPETGDPNFALNFIGFEAENNVVRQGLNLFAIPKLLGFDITDDTATVGITFILQSLYYAGYNVQSAGKIQTPKGSIVAPDDTDCLRFVAGDLLDLAIRPLNLGPPACEENLKNDCYESPSCGTCPDDSEQGNDFFGPNGGNGSGNGCGCRNNQNNGFFGPNGGNGSIGNGNGCRNAGNNGLFPATRGNGCGCGNRNVRATTNSIIPDQPAE
ncbi:MAG: hypothetical protein IJ733_02410 [Lachnospiraceae bacterium]|nr:hypothetical protein [Lachnospiraceae bacterium]